MNFAPACKQIAQNITRDAAYRMASDHEKIFNTTES
jgi:hypothetical protein